MTDEDIARRLSSLDAVHTAVLGVRNDILRVHHDAVEVRSARTGAVRSIPFRDLRNAPRTSTNGVVCRALADAIVQQACSMGHPRRSAQPSVRLITRRTSEMLRWYRRAKRWAQENTDWIQSVKWDRDPARLTARDFLSSYAWAVYVSGFSAKTIDGRWPRLRSAWEGFVARRISTGSRDAALEILANVKKSNAILRVAVQLNSEGWPTFRKEYVQSAATLGRLPWMGMANRRFLARNLRLADLGKPDRWLQRFIAAFGYDDLDETLRIIERATGDHPGLADAYIWAYLSENRHALPL